MDYEKEIGNLNKDATKLLELHKKAIKEKQELQNRINKTIKIINKALCPNSDYVDYDYGSELLRQELLDILQGSDKE